MDKILFSYFQNANGVTNDLESCEIYAVKMYWQFSLHFPLLCFSDLLHDQEHRPPFVSLFASYRLSYRELQHVSILLIWEKTQKLRILSRSLFFLTVTNPQHHDSSLCLKSRGFSEMNCPGQLKINVICYLFLIITLMYFILWMYHINVNTVVAGNSNGEVIRA